MASQIISGDPGTPISTLSGDLNTKPQPNSSELTDVPLVHDDVLKKGVKPPKVPRRIIHFTSGETMEEYSTDEEEDQVDSVQHKIDPKTLKWIPYMWYSAVFAATKALNVADFCGEKLAWFFGITSPKYQYAIDEYKRLKREEEEEKAREAREQEAIRQRRMKELSGMEESIDVSGDPKSGIVNPSFASHDEVILQTEDEPEEHKY